MAGKRTNIIFLLVALMLLTILSVILYYWFNNSYFVKTEDARITGDLVKISPMIGGKLVDLNLHVGEKVRENEIAGRLDVMNLADQNVEQSLIRCPIDGVIVKVIGTVGEMVSAGQVIAYEDDPANFKITANIEETKIHKLRLGQTVDIRIDQYGHQTFRGHVSRIGEATNNVFSILPSTSGSSFTKVVQKVAVDIALDDRPQHLVNGTNTYIKIHIHD